MTRLALPLLLLAAPAVAEEQVTCFPMTTITETLAKKHAERPTATGLSADGKMQLVIYANPATGSWTAVTLRTNGLGCLEMSGSGFEMARQPVPGVQS